MNYLAKRMLPILFIGAMFCAKAQTTIKDIKVGDHCPDLVFKDFIGQPGKSSKLSDFRGKWVVIDFWATWCKPCIDSLPALQAMQERFKDQLQVFAVTYQDMSQLEKSLRESPVLKNIKLPMIYKDSILHKYFVHQSVPHTVVIDEKGVVNAITYSFELTMEKMGKLINHQPVNIKQKQENLKFDTSRPLLFGAMGTPPVNPDLILYSSILTKAVPGVFYFQSPPRINGENYANVKTSGTVIQLFQTAIALRITVPRHPDKNPDYALSNQYSRIIWEAKDSTLFSGIGVNQEKWRAMREDEKCFYYELLAPKKDSANLNNLMLEDINRYFGRLYGIEGLREKRTVKCWALVQFPLNKPIQNTNEGTMVLNNDTHKMTIKGNTVSEFLFWWLIKNQGQNRFPIIDETNYAGKLFFEINAGPNDKIEDIAEKLKPFGYTFIKVERNLDMIVIRDRKI